MNEQRRHNGFGVDLSGSPDDLDRAIAALNAFPALVAACERIVIAWDENDIGQIDGSDIDRLRDALRQAGVE